MSNLENQLDLFHGVVLTQDQEKEVKDWVKRQATNAAEKKKFNNRCRS